MNTDKHGWGLKDYAFPLKPGIFKIQDQPNPQFRNSRIIQHLAAFTVRDSINCLRIYDNRPKCD